MYNYNNLCDNFLQAKKYLGYKYKTDTVIINQIKQFLINNNVNIITKDIILSYAKLNCNIKSNTLARNMNTFREFCKYLKTQDIECYQIPKRLYPQNHHSYIPYIFSKEEIKTIYSNLNFINNNYHYSYDRKISYPLIIKILYQTGMRIGEVLNLTFNDYNQDDNYFLLKNTKNDEERIVSLPTSLNNEFLKFYDKFKYLGTNTKMFDYSKSAIEEYFNNVLKLSNINKNDLGPRLHDLRHTFVVHSIKKFVDEEKDINSILPILQTYLGHNSLNAISYYFHITKDILCDLNKVSEEKLNYLIPILNEVDYE